MKAAAPRRQRGVSTVTWLALLPFLLIFGAFAIDLNLLLASFTELRTAADAGSLEGARVLFCDDGETINHSGCDGNPDVLTSATDAADDNVSSLDPVEVTEVAFGHWEFRTSHQDANGIERGGVFTPWIPEDESDTPEPLPLIDPDTNEFKTFQAINDNVDEINAVRVTTARQATPIEAIFARLLGIDGFQAQATSVAYVGFAGSIDKYGLDAPIAVCEHRIKDASGKYSCGVGRFAPSAETNEDQETAKWTDMTQIKEGDSCGAANASTMDSLVDAMSCTGTSGTGLNQTTLVLADTLTTTNGVQASTFSSFHDCWKGNPDLNTYTHKDGDDNDDEEGGPWPDVAWTLTLPVINCADFSPGDCNPLVGGVSVKVLWVVDNQPYSKLDDNAPWAMWDDRDGDGAVDAGERWVAEDADDITDPYDGRQRWDSFATFFDLRKDENSGVIVCGEDPNQCDGYRAKTMYFTPSCDGTRVGGTGGNNFGIRAEVPVLVF